MKSVIRLSNDPDIAKKIHNHLWQVEPVYREVWNGFEQYGPVIVSVLEVKKHPSFSPEEKRINDMLDSCLIRVSSYNDALADQKLEVTNRYRFTAPMTKEQDNEGIKSDDDS